MRAVRYIYRCSRLGKRIGDNIRSGPGAHPGSIRSVGDEKGAGIIAKVATLVPITTPTIAILRYSMGELDGWEVAVAGAVMLASTYVVIRIASRLFRTGMLMYGKNATFKEIWRWLRHSA